MVYIQAFKGSNKLANGKRGKEYLRHFVIIPASVVSALELKKGDEVEFKLNGRKIYLKKKRARRTNSGC
jgi:AbrB family looped-hinge helix DNA binding protein